MKIERLCRRVSPALLLALWVTPLVSCPTPIGDTLGIDKHATVSLPKGWTAVTPAKGDRSVELVRTRRAPTGDIVEGHVVISSELRRDHTEAVHRLAEIADEQPVASSFTVIDGWPALERRQVVPMPEAGDEDEEETAPPGDRKLVTITAAVAAGDLLVRAEGAVAADLDPAIANEMETIGRSLKFVARADATQTNAELELLRKKATPPPVSAPPEPGPKPSGGSHGDNAVPGAPEPVRPGAGVRRGELEVAVTNGGAGPDDVVVAGNSGVSFSTNGGVTFVPAGFSPGFTNRGDFSVSFGASRNLYMSFIGQPKGQPAALNVTGCTDSVAVSTNAGKTFAFTSHAVVCTGTNCLPDQEHIAADPSFSGGATQDQVYLVWRNFVPGGTAPCSAAGGTTPKIVCSSDGAQTWPTTATIDSGGDFPRVLVGYEGSVLVVYRSGNHLKLNKFTSCRSGLNPVRGFPVTIATVNDISCPVPGLDRCNNGNRLSSHMVAVDQTDKQHIFVAWATQTSSANDDVIVADSSDGGLTWPRRLRVNAAVNARRFLPWVCTIGGTANVTWYDRRAVGAATTNDLTAFFRGSISVSGGELVRGTEVNLSGNTDPQCATWPCAPRSSRDATSCTNPQLAGRCKSGATGSNQPCNFNSPSCPPGESCQTATGCPKYGDYNGNACGSTHVYAAWASGTPPAGATAPGPGISVYVDAIHCGDIGEPCCQGTSCTGTLLCGADQVCTCGGLHQPCCGNSCLAGLACAAGSGPTNTCECGDLGEPCCAKSTCNSALLTCSAEQGCISVCGHRGEVCCHSPTTDQPPSHDGTLPGWCFAGATCNGDQCTCGGLNQPCCASGGTTCDFGLSCTNELCRKPPAGGTCAQCATSLSSCLRGCALDPAHEALCDCLCQSTACDCKVRRGCELSCNAPSCAGL